MSDRTSLKALITALLVGEQFDLGTSASTFKILPTSTDTGGIQLGGPDNSCGLRIHLGAANKYVDFTYGPPAAMTLANVTTNAVANINSVNVNKITLNALQVNNSLTAGNATCNLITVANAATINHLTTAGATTAYGMTILPDVDDPANAITIGNTTHGMDFLWQYHLTGYVNMSRASGTEWRFRNVALNTDASLQANTLTTNISVQANQAAANWGYVGRVDTTQVEVATQNIDQDGALYFDGGAGQTFRIGLSEMQPPYPFSIAFWFKADGTGVYSLWWFGDANSPSHWLNVYEWNGKIYCNRATVEDGSISSEVATVGTNYDDGGWHHIVANFTSDSDIELIINGGAETVTDNVQITHVGRDFDRMSFGRRDDSSPSSQLTGDLDSGLFFPRVLTAVEAAWLYNNNRGRNRADLNTAHRNNPYDEATHHWPMSDNEAGASAGTRTAVDVIGDWDGFVYSVLLSDEPEHSAYDLQVGNENKAGDVKIYNGPDNAADFNIYQTNLATGAVDHAKCPEIQYPFTMAGWAKINTSISNTITNIIQFMGNSSSVYHRVEFLNGQLRGLAVGGPGSLLDLRSTGAAYNDGGWYFYALVCNSATEHKLYAHAEAANTTATSHPIESVYDKFAIGGGISVSSSNIQGAVHGSMLLNTGLNANQVAWLLNSGTPRTLTELTTSADANSVPWQEVISYWPLNEPADQVRRDYGRAGLTLLQQSNIISSTAGPAASTGNRYLSWDVGDAAMYLKSTIFEINTAMTVNAAITADHVRTQSLNYEDLTITNAIKPTDRRSGYFGKKVIKPTGNTFYSESTNANTSYGAVITNERSGALHVTLNDPDTATNFQADLEVINVKSEDKAIDNNGNYNYCGGCDLSWVDLNKGFTMITWMKGTDTSGFGLCVANATNPDQWAAVGTISGKGVAEMSATTGGYDACVTNLNTYNDGTTWHMFAARINSTHLRVWADDGTDQNTLVATHELNQAEPWTRIGVGGRLDSTASQAYADEIDGSVMFNTILTNAQLEWVYNYGRGRTPEEFQYNTHPDNPGTADMKVFYRLSNGATHGDGSQDWTGTYHMNTWDALTNISYTTGVMNTQHRFAVDTFGVRHGIFTAANKEWLQGPTGNPPVVGYPFTQEAWFRTATKAIQYLTWTVVNNHTIDYMGFRTLAGNTINFTVREGGIARSRSVDLTPTEYADNQWHHFLVTCQNTSHREMWFDGVQVDSDAFPVPYTNTWDRFNIGAYNYRQAGLGDAQGFMDGCIQRVMVLNQRVNSDQVEWLFANGFQSFRRLRSLENDVANNPVNYGSVVSCYEFRTSGSQQDITGYYDLTDQNTVGAGSTSPQGYRVANTQSNLIRVGDTSDAQYTLNTFGTHGRFLENQTQWTFAPYGDTVFLTNVEVKN